MLFPEIIRFVTVLPESIAVSGGNDNIQQNLLLIAVGPKSPCTVSLVTKFQY